QDFAVTGRCGCNPARPSMASRAIVDWGSISMVTWKASAAEARRPSVASARPRRLMQLRVPRLQAHRLAPEPERLGIVVMLSAGGGANVQIRRRKRTPEDQPLKDRAWRCERVRARSRLGAGRRRAAPTQGHHESEQTVAVLEGA